VRDLGINDESLHFALAFVRRPL